MKIKFVNISWFIALILSIVTCILDLNLDKIIIIVLVGLCFYTSFYLDNLFKKEEKRE